MKLLKAASLLGAAATLMTSGNALADARVGAVVGVRGGYATNPYASTVNDSGAATITGSFSPTIQLLSPTGSTQIDGDITHSEFSQRYSGATDYSASINTQQQVTPTIAMNGGANYSSRFRNALFANLNPNEPPGGPDDPPVVDPTAGATLAQRIESFGGNLGLTFTLSPRDTLSLYAQGSQVDFNDEDTLARSYDTLSGGFSYMRALNQTTSIGLGVNVARSNYHNETFGDGTQISPSLIVNTQFSPTWSLNLSLGLTFSDTDLIEGSAKRTSFAGSATLCNSGQRSNFCLEGSRSVSPTALSGISTLTSIGASYRYEISARDTFSARAGYSNSKRIYGIFSEDFDYTNATVSYSRKFTRRLSGTVSVSYSDAYSSLVNREANFWGTIGISYRLGDI